MGRGHLAGSLVAFVMLAALLRCGDSPTESDAGADAAIDGASDAAADGDAAVDARDAAKEAGPTLTIACWGATRAPGYNLAAGAQMKSLRGAAEDALTITWTPLDDLSTLGSTNAAGVILTTYAGSFSTISPSLTPQERSALRAFVDAGHWAILLLDNDGFGGGIDPFNDSLANPFGLDPTGTLVGDGGFTEATPTAGGGGVHPIFAGVSKLQQYYPGWLGVLADAGVQPTVIATNSGGPAVDVFAPGALGPSSGAVVVFSDTGSFSDDVQGGATAGAFTVFAQALHWASGK